MTSEQVDITEGFRETFWRSNRDAATILPGVVGGIFAYFLLGLVWVLCACEGTLQWDDWTIIFPFVFFPTVVAFAAMVVAWRTHLDILERGIAFTVFRERFVPWKDVIGIRRMPFGELWIFVAGGAPIRIGSMEGREKIVRLVEIMLSKSQSRDPSKALIKPFEWITRVVFPLIVMAAVLGALAFLVVVRRS